MKTLPIALLGLACLASGPAREPRMVRMDDMLVPASVLREYAAHPFDSAIRLDVDLWEDGVLPLGFDADFTPTQRKQVMDACAEWSKVARVRCVDASYKGRRIRVMKTFDACWSLLGMGVNFGVLSHKMNLADGCFSKATLMHELGHALGLIHEHQRPDRDAYVTIHGENVAGNILNMQVQVNFDRQASKQLTPYDFLSIMHYDRRAFSKNGRDTIVPKPEFTQYIDVMGRVKQLSPLDAALISAAYGPPN
jgi:hypothetical protein